MLKINLLPPYIHQKKMVKVAAGVVTVLTIGEVALMMFMLNGPKAYKLELEQKQAQVQDGLNKLNPLKTESDAILAAEGGMAPKFDFLRKMLDYNVQYPDLYARTAAYTYREATLLNLSATANQLQFNAYVSNPRDVSLLILGLSRSNDFTGLPLVTGVPGFDPATEAQRENQAEGQLPEATIVGGAMTAQGGTAGYGSSETGMPQGGYGGMSAMGGNGPGGPGGGMMSPSSVAAPAMGMGMGMGASGNAPGMEGSMGGMGGGGGTGDLSKLGLDRSPIKPRGFTISVTCALKSTMPRPTYGTSDQQAGGGGGGGGGGMGMGMMGGMGMNGP